MTFQDQLDAKRAVSAPLPLMTVKSIQQALWLRRHGLTYTALATVMTIYHGDPRSGNAWRRLLRSYGAEPHHYPDSPVLRTVRKPS